MEDAISIFVYRRVAWTLIERLPDGSSSQGSYACRFSLMRRFLATHHYTTKPHAPQGAPPSMNMGVLSYFYTFFLRRLRHAGLADQLPLPVLLVVNVPLKVPSGCIEPVNDKLLVV
jgi:hypothetical protein